uniref:Transmembrane protein n=1 Tax=Marseillevirus LCMAC101 TaxID=2506602 RepID=A0A481YRF3_9VIRU|nr:MAG: hypothetical protein LCMAC101_03960 [Marseillevirus LCMAC101]
MDNIQIFIIGFLVVLIIVCMLLKQKEGWYYTQAYYPIAYMAGYGDKYPYYEKLGYKGPGSYGYPGYGRAYADQREKSCKIGCRGNDLYAQSHPGSPTYDQCIKACNVMNPYSM